MNRANRTVALAIAALAVPTLAHAAILASYPFTGGLPASTDVDLASVAQPFAVLGDGGFSTGQNNVFKRTSETQGADLAGAIANTEYFSFTVDPLPGGELDLDRFDFLFGGTNDQTSGPFTANFAVMSSVGGFTAADPVLGSFSKSIPTGTGSTPQLDPASIDLSGLLQFQNLTAPVEFRFYIFDNANISGMINRVDAVTLTGAATVVPEPATASLAILAALPLLRRKRRR